MTKLEKIQKSISKTESDIVLLNENVAEVASLFAEGKATQEDLERENSSLARYQSQLVALHMAAEAAKTQDMAEQSAEVEKLKQKAMQEAKKLMKVWSDTAADVDSAINTFINTVMTHDEIGKQLYTALYEVGLKADVRHHLINLDPVSAVLADAITKSGLYAQLQHFQLNRTDAKYSVADAADKRVSKLKSHLERLPV